MNLLRAIFEGRLRPGICPVAGRDEEKRAVFEFWSRGTTPFVVEVVPTLGMQVEITLHLFQGNNREMGADHAIWRDQRSPGCGRQCCRSFQREQGSTAMKISERKLQACLNMRTLL